MKIVMIYEDSGKPRAAGVRIHALTLSKALKDRGHKVLLFPTRPLHLNDFCLFPFRLLLEIVRILGIEKDVNIIHAHGARAPLILGRFACWMRKIPLVVTIHETQSLANVLNRQYRKASKIIAISEEVKAILRNYGVDETKIVYIPNMVKVNPTHSTAIGGRLPRRILFMGRLHPSKTGILKILLAATPEIVRKLPTTQIWIAGPSSSKSLEIIRMVRDVNRTIGRAVVVFLGYVKDPSRIIQAADVVIGVGRVAIEAMAYGKATMVGSSPPWTNAKFYGDLVTKENAYALNKCNFTGRNYAKSIDSEQLAELVISILTDNDYRTAVGEFSKDFAIRNFGIDNVVDRILSTYVDCLKRSEC